MPTLFTKIINGELPARFVYKDDLVVAFLTVAPLKPGHTLVVPRAEVDHWINLEPAVAQHLMVVAQAVGKAIQKAFKPAKIGLTVLGLEVPHVHLHLVPIQREADMHMANQNRNPDPADMDRAAEAIRRELKAAGVAGVSS
ncbi:MAG: HIT family protein [Phycisphaeraceae bacterium]|nr:HIT family protein [Phycisphaeraceae bacterium]